jgi:hypothetical protein
VNVYMELRAEIEARRNPDPHEQREAQRQRNVARLARRVPQQLAPVGVDAPDPDRDALMTEALPEKKAASGEEIWALWQAQRAARPEAPVREIYDTVRRAFKIGNKRLQAILRDYRLEAGDMKTYRRGHFENGAYHCIHGHITPEAEVLRDTKRGGYCPTCRLETNRRSQAKYASGGRFHSVVKDGMLVCRHDHATPLAECGTPKRNRRLPECPVCKKAADQKRYRERR